MPERRLTVSWNPDGAALQCVTDPAQEAFLRSLHDYRRAADSYQWFNRIPVFQHFPELASRCCLTTDKTSFAHPDTLLLDDTPDVAKAFNKAGGRAIVIPQAWNHWTAAYGSPETPTVVELLSLAQMHEHDESFFINDLESYKLYHG